MNEPYYLYALTWAAAGTGPDSGPGVDPRFAVELIRCGPLAAAASRVGLDEFEVAKLQAEPADLPWLSKVAVRHHEIIADLARRLAVLPMRLGTIFQSRSSLIARLTRCQPDAVEFLKRLGDRQEWAVKLYVVERKLGQSPHPSTVSGGGGARYLAAKAERLQQHHQAKATARQSASMVEDRLRGLADSCQRLRVLPHVLTNRRETMLWNGAFLLPTSKFASFRDECVRLRGELAPDGLMVEVTGPWPAYHFCPSFESHDETSPCPCTS
jgi:hypothetical protein